MSKLFLQRHLKSQWNLEDRFAGWTNAPIALESLDTAKVVSDRFVGEKIYILFTPYFIYYSILKHLTRFPRRNSH